MERGWRERYSGVICSTERRYQGTTRHARRYIRNGTGSEVETLFHQLHLFRHTIFTLSPIEEPFIFSAFPCTRFSMSEPMVSHQNPVDKPKVQAKVHIPRAPSPKLSRPYYLDWVLQHQIGASSLQFTNRVVYLINFCRHSFNSGRGCGLTAHSSSPVPTLHTEILATILRIRDGPYIQAGSR